MKGYPRGFTTGAVATMILLIATGLVLVPTLLYMRLEWDVPWRLPDESRIWLAAAHVVAAFGALALIGALWSVHMRLNWRLRRNRGSGLGVAIVLVLLGATSIGIYYFGDELWSTAASIVHTLAGVAAAAVFAYHWLAGRKIARDRARRPQIVVDSGATLQHARRSETTERPRVRAQR